MEELLKLPIIVMWKIKKGSKNSRPSTSSPNAAINYILLKEKLKCFKDKTDPL